jgi:hypothetical protein
MPFQGFKTDCRFLVKGEGFPCKSKLLRWNYHYCQPTAAVAGNIGSCDTEGTETHAHTRTHTHTHTQPEREGGRARGGREGPGSVHARESHTGMQNSHVYYDTLAHDGADECGQNPCSRYPLLYKLPLQPPIHDQRYSLVNHNKAAVPSPPTALQ